MTYIKLIISIIAFIISLITLIKTTGVIDTVIEKINTYRYNKWWNSLPEVSEKEYKKMWENYYKSLDK